MLKVKDIYIPSDEWSMLTVIKEKGGAFLYKNGVKLGRVKSYEKTRKWILKTYYHVNGIVEFAGKSFSVWVRGNGAGSVMIYSRALTENEVSVLYEAAAYNVIL